ncbi:hypothetical protein CORC01_02675 [Colletotrichum orchidophilum]|uniref:Uncharacterized protein n=1 Tax=Colletotrichum orchidophilum TaxID=1209926 RepID=A0A1G4BLB4_9PEZI|nr:uncharacterized protein CORC01_02675 [Colletotrichum orchidophilum]OHF02096.1 hypothetical protein CORC01_02675 [Colletotrichum orchidophilum]
MSQHTSFLAKRKICDSFFCAWQRELHREEDWAAS